MIEIRQAVSTDVETIAHFNISLCRETEGLDFADAGDFGKKSTWNLG